MKTHSNKTQENKNNAIANNLQKQQGNDEPAFEFADNRPEAIAQRQLQEAANNSPQVKQLSAYQGMANKNHQVKRLNAVPAVQQKTEESAAGLSPEKPVQRVVNWNDTKYSLANNNIGVLRRNLKGKGLSDDEIAVIIGHAEEPNNTYVYKGYKPALVPAAPAAEIEEEIVADDAGPAALGGALLAHDEPAAEIEEEIAVDNEEPAALGGALLADDQPPAEIEEEIAVNNGEQAAVGGPLVAHDQPAAEIEEEIAADDGEQQAIGEEAVAAPVGMPRAAPRRLLPELASAAAWEEYQASYHERTEYVDNLEDPGLEEGDFVYHATPRDTGLIIKGTGLLPRNPEWGAAPGTKGYKKRQEASKDNYLSMSLTEDGAGAPGGRGVAILLRIELTAAEVAPGRWRKASDSEVLTTQSFAPARLRWTWITKRSWKPMNQFVGGQPQ